jgi:HPt (histidine-containing phosphotransfer) domain-containing protein
MPETREHVKLSGMDDYLVKPADESKLIQVITSHLSIVEKSPQAISIETDVTLEMKASGIIRDIEQAISIAGGNPELAQKLFKLFCKDLPQQVDAIHRSAIACNWDELYEAAHSLCGAASICAAESIQHITKELENAARAQPHADIEELLKQLDTAVKLVLKTDSSSE